MRQTLVIRIAIAAAALLVAAWSTGHYLALRNSTTELIARLEAFGTAARRPGAARDVRTETDPVRAGLKAARALLAEELDRRWLAELSPAERQEALDQGEAKLELARDLALEALETRPSSWHGLMILGGSRYLLASRGNAPGRWTSRAGWERPLLAAIERAPYQPEPKRVLSAAYLSEWSIADEAERRAILAVLEDAFRDLDTLDQLLPAWLAKASSFEQALSVIPSDPRAWRQLEAHYRKREDWRRLARVLERWNQSLPRHLAGRLDAARELIEADEGDPARYILMTALSDTPVRNAYAPFLEEAITLLPPGPVSDRQAGVLRRWLDWAFDQCVIAQCPFAETAARRLTRLAREAAPSRRARSALIARNLAEAEAIEERAMTAATEEWLPYLLLKALHLARSGDHDRSQRVLAGLPNSGRYRALAEHVRRAVGATAFGGSPDSGWLGDANSKRREWIVTPMPARLVVPFEYVGAGGATLEVRVNGALEGFYGIGAGSVLRLEPPENSALVVLELEREAGANFRPAGSI
ncbi:MAG: hypothetical protein ACE5GX_06355 [Thermoanaerobaculia bacterium]